MAKKNILLKSNIPDNIKNWQFNNIITKGALEFNSPTQQPVVIEDNRKVSPTTGKLLKQSDSKTIETNRELIQSIIAQAKARNIDPKIALSIGYQEGRLGLTDDNIGHNLLPPSQEWLDNEKTGQYKTKTDKDASILIDGIKQKFDYANKLGKTNLVDSLQVYNGLGKLTPSTESKYYKGVQQNSFYGVPVNKNNPIDLSKNPLYGKTVKSIADSVIGTNLDIQSLIKNTKPFEMEKKKLGGKLKKYASGGIIGADGKSETQPQGMGAGAITGIVGNALDTVGNFIPVDNDGRGVSKKGQAISGGIQTGLDSAADIANSIPGGQIIGGALKIGSFLTKGITAIVDAVKERKHPTDELVNEKYSPTYKDSSFSFGNNILALGGDTSNNPQNQFKQYDTVSHAEGGQNIDANNNPTANPHKAKAEIEKQENSYKNYVFSDELGFAKLAAKINKKYDGREDLISKNSLDIELTGLMKKNEKVKTQIEQNQKLAQNILKLGGLINNKRNYEAVNKTMNNSIYSPDGKFFTNEDQYKRYQDFYNPQELIQPIINNYDKIKIKNNTFQFKNGGIIKKYGNGGFNDYPSWLSDIPQYEYQSGAADGTGLSNYGLNKNLDGTPASQPKDLQEATTRIGDQYLPLVKDYPSFIQPQLLDYKYNSGRSIKDLLLYSQGKISLSDINSKNTYDKDYDTKYKAEIEKAMQEDPKGFYAKLVQARHDVAKTTGGYSLNNPNPTYEKTWKNRINNFQYGDENPGTGIAEESVYKPKGISEEKKLDPSDPNYFTQLMQQAGVLNYGDIPPIKALNDLNINSYKSQGADGIDIEAPNDNYGKGIAVYSPDYLNRMKKDSEFYKPGQVGTAKEEDTKKQFSPEAIAGYGIKGIEMLGHAIQAFKKPDLVNPVYNPEENKVKSLMSNRKFDSQAILDALDLQDTANRQNINDNSTSVGVIQANLQKANANQVNAIANTKIQEQQTNNQYRADEAQVLNNLGQQKMQAQVYAEDANAKSKANVQMQRDKFLKESIGGLGDFLLKKDYVNKDNNFQMNILKSKGINFTPTDYNDWNKAEVDIAKFIGELESETDTAKRKAKMEEVHQKFLAKGGTEEAWQSNSIAQGLTNKYLK